MNTIAVNPVLTGTSCVKYYALEFPSGGASSKKFAKKTG